MTVVVPEREVLIVGDVGAGAIRPLLERFGLQARFVAGEEPIPGSYWGEPEAGIVGTSVHMRADTPVHSVLHEMCHIICMDAGRRNKLDRDAGSDDLEESAVCYLQIVLADEVHGLGRHRLMRDMDAWGYSFRLGSTERWFVEDAADAAGWLQRYGLLTSSLACTFQIRA